jgi:hypothetical protein
MHGGAHGSGAPKGPRNGNYKHGRYTAEAIQERRQIMTFVRDARKHAASIRSNDFLSTHTDCDYGYG